MNHVTSDRGYSTSISKNLWQNAAMQAEQLDPINTLQIRQNPLIPQRLQRPILNPKLPSSTLLQSPPNLVNIFPTNPLTSTSIFL
jgi:hypothetical protein